MLRFRNRKWGNAGTWRWLLRDALSKHESTTQVVTPPDLTLYQTCMLMICLVKIPLSVHVWLLSDVSVIWALSFADLKDISLETAKREGIMTDASVSTLLGFYLGITKWRTGFCFAPGRVQLFLRIAWTSEPLEDCQFWTWMPPEVFLHMHFTQHMSFK